MNRIESSSMERNRSQWDRNKLKMKPIDRTSPYFMHVGLKKCHTWQDTSTCLSGELVKVGWKVTDRPTVERSTRFFSSRCFFSLRISTVEKPSGGEERERENQKCISVRATQFKADVLVWLLALYQLCRPWNVKCRWDQEWWPGECVASCGAAYFVK